MKDKNYYVNRCLEMEELLKAGDNRIFFLEGQVQTLTEGVGKKRLELIHQVHRLRHELEQYEDLRRLIKILSVE